MDQWEQEWMLLQNQQQNNNSWAQDDAIDFGAPANNSWAQDDAIDFGSNGSWAQDDAVDAGGSGGYYGGGAGGGAWWDTPSFTPSFAPSFTPTFTAQQGLGVNPYAMGSGFSGQPTPSSTGTATSGQGSGANVTLGSGGFGSGSFTTTPAASSSGSTSAFGVDPNWRRDDEIDRGTVLENSLNTAQNVVGSGLSTVKDKVGGALSAVDDYARTNPMGARLGLEGAGLLIGAYNQRAANKEARRVNDMQARDRENLRALQAEQMQMQREMYERSNQQLERNNQLADQFNTQATQSVNEARSLYNPQEMAIRAMAQQQMGTQNLITAGERDMRRRGMSDAAIAAETRRARLGGTTGATTAYTKGLDVGRQAQQSALTSAKGLSQQYGGVGAAPALTTNLGGDANYTLANTLSKSGADTTANLKSLLNLYLGDPITRSDQEIRRQTQKESVK